MRVRGLYSLLWLLLLPTLASGDLLLQLAAIAPPSPYGCSRLLSLSFIKSAEKNLDELAGIDKSKRKAALGEAKAFFINSALLAQESQHKAVTELVKALRANRHHLATLPEEAHSIVLHGENNLLLWAMKKIAFTNKCLNCVCREIERARYTYEASSPSLRKERSKLLQDFLYIALVARLAADENDQQAFLDIYPTLRVLGEHPKLSEKERALGKLALGHFTLNFGTKKLENLPKPKSTASLAEEGNDLAAGLSLSLKSFRSKPPIELPEARKRWEESLEKLISSGRRAYWLLFLEAFTTEPRPSFQQRLTRLCCDLLRLRELGKKEKKMSQLSFGPAMSSSSLCLKGLTVLVAMAHDHLKELEKEKYFLKACLDWFACPFTRFPLGKNKWSKVEGSISPTSAVGIVVLATHRQMSNNMGEYLDVSALAFEKLVFELDNEKNKERRQMLVFALMTLCRHRWPLLCQQNDFDTVIPEALWVSAFTSKVVKEFKQLAPLHHRTLWTLAQLCQLDYLNFRQISKGRENLEEHLRQVLNFPDMVILRHHCKMVLGGKRLVLK